MTPSTLLGVGHALLAASLTAGLVVLACDQPAAPGKPRPPAVRANQPTNHQPANRCAEDQPCWNCLTMGNHRCGPGYVMVDDTAHPATWIAMIEGDHHGYDPYRCLVEVGPSTVIVCQDGWRETS